MTNRPPLSFSLELSVSFIYQKEHVIKSSDYKMLRDYMKSFLKLYLKGPSN